MQLILALLILVGIPLLIFFVICVIGSLIFSFFSETRKMPNHNPKHPGITDTTPNGVKDIMKRIIYWLKRKKRKQEKHCGGNCLICKYYNDCSLDEH